MQESMNLKAFVASISTKLKKIRSVFPSLKQWFCNGSWSFLISSLKVWPGKRNGKVILNTARGSVLNFSPVKGSGLRRLTLYTTDLRHSNVFEWQKIWCKGNFLRLNGNKSFNFKWFESFIFPYVKPINIFQ